MIFPRALVGKFDRDAMRYLRLFLPPKTLARLLGVPDRLIKADRDLHVPYSVGQFAAALWLCGLLKYKFSDKVIESQNILPKIAKITLRLVNARAAASLIHRLLYDLHEPLRSDLDVKMFLTELANKGIDNSAEVCKVKKPSATTRDMRAGATALAN